MRRDQGWNKLTQLLGKEILQSLEETEVRFSTREAEERLKEISQSTWGNQRLYFQHLYQTFGEIFVQRCLGRITPFGVFDQKLNGAKVSVEELYLKGLFQAWITGFCPLEDGRWLVRFPLIPSREIESRQVILAPWSVLSGFLLPFRFVDFCERINDYPRWFDLDDLVRFLLLKARTLGTSDIHLSYDPHLSCTVVQVRQDGLLREIDRIPEYGQNYHVRVANKIQALFGLENVFNRPADGSLTIEIPGHEQFSLRVSTVPAYQPIRGKAYPSIVIRILRGFQELFSGSLSDLGFSDDFVTVVEDFTRLPSGIFFIAGPTGSGKSTTLYSLLRMILDRGTQKVLTVEDPVEMELPGAIQVEVREEQGLSFADALRAFLRHDPDVILVGEVRDPETAKKAIEAAQTGHLVFATLHANDTMGVISRLALLGVARAALAEVIRVVLSQRLIRRLCPHCRQVRSWKELSEDFQRNYASLGLESWSLAFPRPGGCKRCRDGYLGRIPLWELVLFGKDLRNLLRQRQLVSEDDLYQRAAFSRKMRAVALELIRRQETSLEEVERFVPLKATLTDV